MSDLFSNPSPWEFYLGGMPLHVVAGSWLTYRLFYETLLRLHVPKQCPPAKRLEWPSRIVSSVHALVMFVVSTYLLWTTPGLLHNNRQACASWNWWLATSYGYTIYDSLLVSFGYRDFESVGLTLVHHIGLIVIHLPAPLFGIYEGLSCLAYVMEGSTVFVNNRWLLYVQGQTESKAYVFNALSMIVSFFLCRVCLAPYLEYRVIADSAVGSQEYFWCWLDVLVFGMVFTVLNYYWFSLMVRGAIKRLGGTKESPPSEDRRSTIAADASSKRLTKSLAATARQPEQAMDLSPASVPRSDPPQDMLTRARKPRKME